MSHTIEEWQHSLTRDGEASATEPDGLLARLSNVACELYRAVLDSISSQLLPSAFRRLEREYGYLRLWSDGYGVSSGDLDVALAESKRLRRDTLRLLLRICHTLAGELVLLVDGPEDNEILKQLSARTRDIAEAAAYTLRGEEDDASDNDSDDGSLPLHDIRSVEEATEDLKTDIRCLIDLGPRFEEPIRDRTVEEEAARGTEPTTWDLAQYFADRIRHRYPNGNNNLISTLGSANWERAKRLYATKKKNSQEIRLPSAGADFSDSGLGTSIATPSTHAKTVLPNDDSRPSSYAETIFSYDGSNRGSIRVPPLPIEGLAKKPFPCTICGQTVCISKATFWKKHVISDLKPYVCIIATCKFSSVPFFNKETWVEHLDLDHGFGDSWEDISCPLCQQRTKGGKEAVVSHLTRHLEEVSLTILPANADSDNESDDSSLTSLGSPAVDEPSMAASASGAATKRIKGASKSGKLLACPFWKKDCQTFSDCNYLEVTTITNLKQHLHREHFSIRCARCRATFHSEAERDNHIRSETCCLRTGPDGISVHQAKELNKKGPASLTQEEQWYIVWGVVFPGLTPPSSPYLNDNLSEDQSGLSASGRADNPAPHNEDFAEPAQILTKQLSDESPPQGDYTLSAVNKTLLRKGANVNAQGRHHGPPQQKFIPFWFCCQCGTIIPVKTRDCTSCTKPHTRCPYCPAYTKPPPRAPVTTT